MNNISVDNRCVAPCHEVVCRSDIGGREEQQDSAYAFYDNELTFAIVCDGMGGTEEGARASRIAVDRMRELLSTYVESTPPADLVRFLSEAMTELDSCVSGSLGKQRGGTTAVAAAIQRDNLFWFSAGDSRLYIYRAGEMVQATRDHNYFLRLDEQLKNGAISREFYQKEAEKGEALISFMGVGGLPVFDLTNHPFSVTEGDILLLTTDGLYKAIPEELICHILRGNDSLSRKADRLMKQIEVLKQSVALDNTTFILIRIN